MFETISDIVDNNLNTDDPQWLADELSDLEAIEKKHQLGLRRQIASVHHLLSEAEENSPAEEDYDGYRGSSGTQSIGNDALTDMFSTLLR